MVRKLLIAGAAASLIAGPIAAQESANARQSAPVSGESELSGDSPLIYLLGIAVVAAAIVFLSEDNDPVSP